MPERGLRGEIVLAIGCTDGMGFSAAKYIGIHTLFIQHILPPLISFIDNHIQGIPGIPGIQTV